MVSVKMFKVEGDDILFEIDESSNTKKILIYVNKVEDKYVISCKCFGTYYLEQTLDDNNNVIKEVIKNNPNKIDWELPKIGIFND